MLTSITILLVFILFFSWRGFSKGAGKTLQGLLTLILAYSGTYYFVAWLSEILQRQQSWSSPVSYIAASLILFLGISFLLKLLFLLFRALLNRRRNEENNQPSARITGALLGAVLGCFLGLLGVWMAGILQDAATMRQGGNTRYDTHSLDIEVEEDIVKKSAGQLMGSLAGFALESQMGEGSSLPSLASSLIAEPFGMSEKISQMIQSDSLKQLFVDPINQKYLFDKNVDALLRSDAFINLMASPETVDLLLLMSGGEDRSEKSNDDTSEERDNSDKSRLVAKQLIDLWYKSLALQQDPRFTALMEDPEFRANLENPNALALLTDPKIHQVAEIVFSLDESTVSIPKERQSLRSLPSSNWQQLNETIDGEDKDKKGKMIYRWIDERGKKHFSEEKPEGNFSVESIPQ